MRLLCVGLATLCCIAAHARGYLWISCEHLEPYAIYRFNLQTRQIDKTVVLDLVSGARVYNNLAFDGQSMYAGTNGSNLIAKLNPYSGRVRSQSQYIPAQNISFEQGAYNPITRTLWRAGNKLIETSTNGTVLRTWTYNGQLYGIQWINGVLYATDYNRFGYITFGATSVNFVPLPLIGAPTTKVALAYDCDERILYLSSFYFPTQAEQLYAINLDTMQCTMVADLSFTGYPIGFSNADATCWVPEETEMWSARLDGVSSTSDSSNAIVVDPSGNAYVCGFSERADGNQDWAVAKYSAGGKELWHHFYEGIAGGSDDANFLTLVPGGGVCVTGRSDGAGSSWDILTINYASDGSIRWSKRYNGPANNVDMGTGVTSDANGNVYVCGHSMGAEFNPDYVVLKYDPNGNLLWERRYSNGDRDVPITILLDSHRNVLVSGWSASANMLDYVTIKYDNDGNQLWLQRYDGPGHGDDVLRQMVLDEADNVYICGRSWGAGVSWDFGTVKYSSSGQQLWVRRVDVIGGPDESNSLAVTPDGLVVAGWTDIGGNADVMTVKYDRNGNLLWQRIYDSPSHGIDRAQYVVSDKNGRTYVTGRAQGLNGVTDYDIFVIAYDQQGQVMWQTTFNGPADGDEGATMCALSNDLSLYVAGESAGMTGGRDWVTLRYSPFHATNTCNIVAPHQP